ncbi:MAG: DUF1294 domain-containing protein [Clostridia bacterium]|nr:DUF1294 domain-containing protein [Clostridia bacterium]
MYYPILLTVYIVCLSILSIVAFASYASDKFRAKSGAVRIQEKTLLALAVFGGAVGAFLARLIFRHKTKKLSFSIVVGLSLTAQIGVLALMLILL